METEQVKQIIEEAMAEITERINGIFADNRGRGMARQYIKGLMSTAERKNGWQMAEALGQKTPYAIQQFLYRGGWDANELRNSMREYVKEKLGDSQSVMVVDETGFLKKGKNRQGNASVQRYCAKKPVYRKTSNFRQSRRWLLR